MFPYLPHIATVSFVLDVLIVAVAIPWILMTKRNSTAAVAWCLVVNRVPVAAAREECEALKRHVAGRRFAELSLQGFAAVLDTMDGRFEDARTALLRSRDGLRDLGLHEASIWMALFDAQAHMLAGNAAPARIALDEAEQLAAEIGDRWFQSTILVDRAHAGNPGP